MDEHEEEDFSEEYIIELILKETLEGKGYTLGRIIGEGGFAKVYLVSRIHGGHIMCAKVIYANCAILKEQCQAVKDTYNAEMSLLKMVNHPNVISIYNYFVVGHFHIIVLEYCPNGTLADLIRKKKLSRKELFKYTQELLNSLKCLHAMKISHHDIKPSNCLIDNYGRLKLSDFGLAQRYFDAESAMRRGTLAFVAPEVIKEGVYDPFKADVWSFGVTLYYMATGRLPFHEAHSIARLYQEQRAWGYHKTSGVPSEIGRIIGQCLTFDPSHRIEMESIKLSAGQLPSMSSFPRLVAPMALDVPQKKGLPKVMRQSSKFVTLTAQRRHLIGPPLYNSR